MILQALSDYYERAVASQPDSMPPPGWERRRLPFVIEITRDGGYLQIVDTRSADGRDRRGSDFLVPAAPKRSVNIAPSLLWDNVEYTLGVPVRNHPIRVARAHQAFVDAIRQAFRDGPRDPGIDALLRFVDPVPLERLEQDALWQDLIGGNPFISFRLSGDIDLICHRPAVRSRILSATDLIDGRCLVTGGTAPIARLHPSIKGVRNANTSGASLVSFNLASFESYGRSQGDIAPISNEVAFRYGAALNHLLRSDSPQRATLGDSTYVFWAEAAAENPYEAAAAWLFTDPPRDDPDRGVAAISQTLAALRAGASVPRTPGRFYLLGLAPNAARLAVRAWVVEDCREIGRRIISHYDDLEIDRPSYATRYPSLRRLLRSVALQGKLEHVPPNLEGELVRAVLDGRPYPIALLEGAVRRSRAERSVTPERAALIKAAINRTRRSRPEHDAEELTVALDPANQAPAYRLGRLFAALERAQELASPSLNTTIRDRYYGAASTTPITVFPRLLDLKNHHIAKIGSAGIRTWLERLIGEIVDGIPRIPAHLTLVQQGDFAIGYYHQRQDFFRKRTDIAEEAN